MEFRLWATRPVEDLDGQGRVARQQSVRVERDEHERTEDEQRSRLAESPREREDRPGRDAGDRGRQCLAEQSLQRRRTERQ